MQMDAKVINTLLTPLSMMNDEIVIFCFHIGGQFVMSSAGKTQDGDNYNV